MNSGDTQAFSASGAEYSGVAFMKLSNMPVVALALVLCACGGGSSSGGGGSSSGGTGSSGGSTSGGTPTPTPSPIAYTKVADLTGNQQFKTACGGLYGPNERIDAFGFGRSDTVQGALSIDYASANQNWTVAGQSYSGAPFSYVFTPAMIQTPPSPETTYYRKDNADGSRENFYISARSLGGTPPEYVRGSLLTYRIGTALPEYRYCVFGVPTQLADTKPASTVTYTNTAIGGIGFISGGATITQYDLSESTVTVSANPTTGAVPVQLTLVGRAFTPAGLSDTRVQLGVYSGTASVSPTVQSFNDAINTGDRALIGGNFGGWFFGPQGIEIGFAYSIKAQNPDGTIVTAAGAVTGRR